MDAIDGAESYWTQYKKWQKKWTEIIVPQYTIFHLFNLVYFPHIRILPVHIFDQYWKRKIADIKFIQPSSWMEISVKDRYTQRNRNWR